MTAKPVAPSPLPVDLEQARLPKHVAVIMDGNGRFPSLSVGYYIGP